MSTPSAADARQPRLRWWRHLPLVLRALRPRSLHRAAKLLPAVLARSGREVRIDVPGWRAPVVLRARTSDVLVAVQILLLDELPLPPRGDVDLVIDAGANIGLSALTFAHRWPGASIVCLEVDDANLALLRRNTEPYPAIRVVPAGLWRRAARLRLANPGAPGWAIRVEEHEHGPIEAMGVDDLLDETGAARIDVLKVDIEGSEAEVFGPESEAWLDRVGTVMVELHELFRPGSAEAIRTTLQRAGFRLAHSGEYLIATRPTDASLAFGA